MSGQKYSYIPLEKLTATPSEEGFHHLMTDRWWAIDPERGAIIYRGGDGKAFSPQCNAHRSIVERLGGIHEHAEPQFIERAWLSHDCHDYV
jgi:hypothetical protein